MAVSMMWIKNNMLAPPYDQYERQLTEAELKVQRSLRKLSIPDWYLNKRSNPPKILVNVTPIESRPSSWKSFESKKDSTFVLTSSSLSDTLPCIEPAVKNIKNVNNGKGTYKICKQQTKQKKSPSKSPPAKKEEAFDTTIPKVKLSSNISRTFPKVSPSRKIENINIVFASRLPILVSNDSRNDSVVEDSKYDATLPLEKESIVVDAKNDIGAGEMNGSCWRTPLRNEKNENFRLSEMKDMAARTPNVKRSFNVRATSTPKFTPANLFSSTIVEETPKAKKVPSRNILEKSSIFEESSKLNGRAEKSLENATRQKKSSQNLLEKTSIYEGDSKSEESSSNFETSRKAGETQPSLLLERNIRSIDPILFEKNDAGLSPVRHSSVVREIVNRLETSGQQVCASERRFNSSCKNIDGASLRQKKSNLDKKTPVVRARTSNLAVNIREKKTEPETQSLCANFLCSRKESTDLEKTARNKQPVRENTVVQKIIEALTRKADKSPAPWKNEIAEIDRNFVKKLVNALEKGSANASTTDRKNFATKDGDVDEEEPTSCSESEGKSCATSGSLKDTDSSDTDRSSDRRSPSLGSDEDNRTFDFTAPEIGEQLENEWEPRREDDSVYWIPVSRCKLPRTSSLLSMMSRLSGNGQSPCVSPIRSENEVENTRTAAWGKTFDKRNNVLPRKLFRIDETTVIDSGYSDKSDRSGISGSATDSTWSEDTRDDTLLENRASRAKRSTRRKTIVGHTFRVSC